MTNNWERRVYAHYVSTGNLPETPDPRVLFGPRKPYIEKIICEHIPQNSSTRVLELACGPAPFLYFLKQRGYSNLMGIDTSPQQVVLAHAIGLENEVAQGDMIAYLEVAEPDYFDVIIMFDILEHFARPEQFDIMDKVFARLKPNGKCILHVPNAEGIFGTRVLYGDITHKSAFTRRSMEQLLQIVGFKNIQCFEDKPILHGMQSSIRRAVWEIVSAYVFIAVGAETGNIRRRNYIFSQNMLVIAEKL